MSVIVAKNISPSCTGASTISCIPAISLQTIILPSTSIIIDELSISDFASTKWYVVLTSINHSITIGFEIHATHTLGSLPSYNVYSIIGDYPNIDINVEINSNKLQLIITNNELVSLLSFSTRLALPFTKKALKGLSGINIANINSAIDIGLTSIIDEFQYSKTQACKWLVTISTPNDNKVATQVFSIMNSSSLGINNEYGIIGDLSINYNLFVDTNLNSIQLKLTNNYTTPLFINVTRIPIITKLPPSCNIPTSDISIWWNPTKITIPATTNTLIDTNITVPGHTACKWLIYIYDQLNNQSESLEFWCTRQQLNSTNDTIYSMLSHYFNIDLSITIIGLDLNLFLNNNETFPLDVYLIRIPVSL